MLETVIVQRADAVGEADRLAHLADPVIGTSDLGIPDEGAGEGGDHRSARRRKRHLRRHPTEVREHGLHERRVERMRDGEPLGAHPQAARPAIAASTAIDRPEITT